MLKVYLQYRSMPFLNYFIYVWRIHFKNIQTILSHAKMRWCVPHARLALAMLLHHTPSLENFHGLLSMLLNLCFILPAGIFNWMSLPLDQVFKVFFLPGLIANPFVQYAFHIWLL
jgi:hypothetical protein